MTDRPWAGGEWTPLLRVGLAGAACWHLLGNAALTDGVPALLVGGGAAAVALLPRSRSAFAGLTAAVWISIWQEAPILGNHWLLTGLVCLAVALAGLDRRPAAPVAAAQAVVLVFYGFAAFAKLNADFFDPSTSCATYYAAESAASLGWAIDRPTGALGFGLVVAVSLTELLVPILLVLRRTRQAGVALAVTFHAFLALDHRHQFFDFTMLLSVVFVTFLPAAAAVGLLERTGGPSRRLLLRALLAGLAVVAALVGGGDHPPDTGFELGYAAWAATTLVLVPSVLRWCWRHRVPADEPVPNRLTRWAVPVVGLALLNGLSPYLELKTGAAWNMYANLRTADGDSNHFLVRATLPVGGAQDDLVEVVQASGALGGYVGGEVRIARRQLRWFLQEHPGEGATIRVDGETHVIEPGEIPEVLGPPVPDVVGRLLVLRAVVVEGPVPCQDGYLAAT